MDSSQYRRICRLFEQALDVAPEARDAFLDRECEGDGPVREAVERALREAEDDGGFLDGAPFAGILDEVTHAPCASLPEQVGSYRIIRRIGSGGMGEVYLAEQDRPRRRVALKLIRSGLAGNEAVRRLEQEAELLGRLQHPNIAQVHEAGRVATPDGPRPFIAMQYVPGRTALPESEPRTRDELDRVLGWMEKVARALHVAHEQGVIHRDVKPHNVRITPEGEPVLLDFGIARDTGGETPTLTRTGSTPGTPAYMSPEQVRGAGERLDRRTDVWSLGVTLHECLTLHRPFDEPTRELLHQRILTQEPSRLLRLNPAIPRELEAVVATALEKEPDRRYRTAAALADDLKAVRENRPVSVRRITPAGRMLRWTRRHPARAALAASLVAGLAVVAALVGFIAAGAAEREKGRKQLRLERIERLLEQGFLDLEWARTGAAAEAFEEALLLSPASVEAVTGLVETHRKVGDDDGALGVLTRHEGQARDHPALGWLRVDLLRARGETAAADALEQTLRARPVSSAVGFFVLGRRAALRGELGDAAAHRRSLELFTKSVLYSEKARDIFLFERARAAANARDARAARETADILRHRRPRSPRAWLYVGQALRHCDPDGAVAALRKAIRLAGGNLAEAWSYIGVVHRVNGDPESAVEAHREAVRQAPAMGMVHHNLGLALYDLGRLDEALAAFGRALELLPGSVAPLHAIGNVHLARRELPQAVAAYERALAGREDYLDAALNLASVHVMTGRADRAIDALRPLGRLYPHDPRVHRGLGLAFQVARRWDESVVHHREATRLDPEQAVAWKELGDALTGAGRPREALEAFRSAFEVMRREASAEPTPPPWLSAAESLVARLDEVEALQRGEWEPPDAVARLGVADAAQRTGRPLLAARQFAMALSELPHTLALAKAERRHMAAVVAARCAHGEQDAASLDASERSAWCRQAVAWLREDLEVWDEAWDEGRIGEAKLRERLEWWRRAPALAGVRDDGPLAALAPEDRELCRRFWIEVDEILAGLTD